MGEETLAKLGERLLSALKESLGEFVGRAEIARRIGKRQLNARDVAALDYLVEIGRAEKLRVDDPRPVGYRMEYRAK